MAKFVVIESKIAIIQKPNQTSDDFILEIPEGINLHQTDKSYWQVGLFHASIWNTIPNISSNYGNQNWEYSPDNGVTWFPHVVPEGTYSIEDLNDYIHSVMFSAGHYGGSPLLPQYAIEILPNYQTSRVTIKINLPVAPDPGVGYQFRLLANLTQLLGFSVPADIAVTTIGDIRADITMGVNQISINADVVDSEAGLNSGGSGSNIIHVYLPDKAPGSLLSIQPYSILWLPLNQERIKKIHVYFRDSLNRPVDFRGEDVVITLVFRTVLFTI